MNERADAPGPTVRETQEIWDEKAAFWDAGMGDGNAFQRVLVGPSAERLLAVQPGQRVLDLACGNGVFTRRLAQLGARVIGVDFSQAFVDLASAKSTEYDGRIEYRQVDATDEAQMLALGEESFDAVVCNMAIMDMPAVDPLMRSVARLLKPGGPFVFSVPHPAFNSNDVRLGMEEEDRDGRLVETRYLRVTTYLRVPPGKGMGMPGEPAPHWYFHRPLNELFNAGFAAGFVLDGLEEPSFGSEDANQRPLSWMNYTNIPPVLVARLRQLR